MTFRHLLIPLVLTLPATGATDTASLFPESTVAYASVRDISALRKLGDHPVAKLFQQEALKDVFGMIMTKAQEEGGEEMAAAQKALEDETGMKLEELMEKFNGAIGGAVYDVKLPDGDGDPQAEFAVVADFTGDDALVQKLLDAADKLSEGELAGSIEQRTDDHDGAKVHVLKEKDNEDAEEFAWAVTDGRLVVASGADEVKEILDRAKKGGGAVLAGSAIYKELDAVTDGADIQMGMQLSSILEQAQEMLRKQMEDGENALPVNPLQIWSGLGADKLRGAVWSFRFKGESMDMDMALTHTEKPGLLTLFPMDAPGKAPAFIPATATDAGYGTFKFDVMFENLEKLVNEAAPLGAGAMNMALQQGKQATGVDIKEDIFGNLGPDFWVASHSDGESLMDLLKNADSSEDPMAALNAQSTIIGVGLKDSKAMEDTLKSLINATGQAEGIIQTRELHGATISSLKAGDSEVPPLSWTITSDNLILSVGKVDLFEKILARMKTPDADHFFAQPHVEKALAALPSDGQGSASYGSMDNLIPAMAAGFASEMDLGEDVLKKLMDVKLPGAMVSKTYFGDKATVVRYRIVPVEK